MENSGQGLCKCYLLLRCDASVTNRIIPSRIRNVWYPSVDQESQNFLEQTFESGYKQVGLLPPGRTTISFECTNLAVTMAAPPSLRRQSFFFVPNTCICGNEEVELSGHMPSTSKIRCWCAHDAYISSTVALIIKCKRIAPKPL